MKLESMERLRVGNHGDGGPKAPPLPYPPGLTRKGQRQWRIDNGYCQRCNQKSEGGYNRCQFHRDRDASISRGYRA